MEGACEKYLVFLLLTVACLNETARGNQREIDRQRAQARTGKKGPKKEDGLTPEQRRERDAKALQEKTAKKAALASGVDAASKTKKK